MTKAVKLLGLLLFTWLLFVLAGSLVNDTKGLLTGMRTMWFGLAFTSIGLETRFVELTRTGGGRPAAAFLIGQAFNVVWTLLLAPLFGVRSRTPWSLLGQLLFRPLGWAGIVARVVLLAGGRLPGLGAPMSSVDRVTELDRERGWLRGDTRPGIPESGEEARAFVATLHQFGEALVDDDGLGSRRAVRVVERPPAKQLHAGNLEEARSNRHGPDHHGIDALRCRRAHFEEALAALVEWLGRGE